MVQTLATGELRRELTYDGQRAVEAAERARGGRRPAVVAEKSTRVRTAYLEAGPSPPRPRPRRQRRRLR
ncbi:hypothetical protein ACFQ78_33460 [Streptomyces sp. NPDC056519]|uniref:hypothetical protein n=1 Tax=Streptomyces sp. NPDC056519 TaxID=3345849 RepID=UPI00367ECCC4